MRDAAGHSSVLVIGAYLHVAVEDEGTVGCSGRGERAACCPGYWSLWLWLDAGGNAVQPSIEHVAVDYWGTRLNLGRPFDVITATNVFAHVADPADFLEACRRHLSNEGIVIIEVPYCRTMLDECHFDTIYHEHLSYFLAAPCLRFFERCVFCVADVVPVQIHGGSLHGVLRRGRGPHCRSAADLAEREGRDGLLAPGKYVAYAVAAERKRAALRELLSDGSAVGYGAAAKGNTLLNFCGLSYSLQPFTQR